MTLIDWHMLTLQELREFVGWYTKAQRDSPIGFPADLPSGDWNEQFDQFITTQPDITIDKI